MTNLLARRDDEPWREPDSSGYQSEAVLRYLIAAHPELIPGITHAAVVCTEFQSDVGPADVLVIDSDSRLTIVECKLAANPGIRREVIEQVLDDASRIWEMPIDAFEDRWIARTGASPFTGDADGLQLRENFALCLAASRFTLVLAVDQINGDLKRIVQFVNQVTGPETGVVAVQFLRSTERDLEILIPETFGSELVEKKAKTTTLADVWSPDEFLEWCSGNDPDAAARRSTPVNGSGGRLLHRRRPSQHSFAEYCVR